MTDHALVIVTCGSAEEARSVARHLVECGLAAGAQMLPIESLYRWEREIVDDAEWLLICKTRSDRYAQIEAAVRERHSYDVAPIYMVEMSEGSRAYFDWIDDATAEP